MRVVFMGSPGFAVPALKGLVAAGHELAAVYCQPPRVAGRGQKSRPGPVHQAAQTMGLTVRHPPSLRDAETQAAFAALGADVAVVAAYGLILPRAILQAPRLGCLNIHASLLPRWRGAAPIHRAVLAGDAETGVCIMQMEPGLDTGPVLLGAAQPIGPEDTTGDLHDRLAQLGAELVVAALAQLDRLTPVAQPQAGITYAHKIDKAEGRIDWTGSAVDIDRQIRGLSPFPGAWCRFGDIRLKLLRCRLCSGDVAGGDVAGGDVAGGSVAGGTLVAGRGEGRLVVACGDGRTIEITQLQREGKRPMPAAEALRGLDLLAGVRLG